MNISEAMTLIEGLRGRMSVLSPEDKTTIATMYPIVLGKPFLRTRCNDCYRDAVIEMYLQLTKHGTMISELRYRLRAGIIIHSPLFYGGKVFSNANLTDDIAKEYLAMFPNKRTMFDSVPAEKAEEPKPKPKRIITDESKPSKKKRKKS